MNPRLAKQIPPLIRISALEAESIASMFSLYDIHCTGRIANHLVIKLIKQLGRKINDINCDYNY